MNFFNIFCLFESIESQIFELNRTNFEWIPIWLHPYDILCHENDYVFTTVSSFVEFYYKTFYWQESSPKISFPRYASTTKLLPFTGSDCIKRGLYCLWYLPTMKRLQRGILASIWYWGKKEVNRYMYIDLDYDKIKTLFGRVLSFFFPAFWDDGGNFKGSFHKAIFLSNSKRCFEQKPISLLAGKEKVDGEESSPFFWWKKASFSGTSQSA